MAEASSSANSVILTASQKSDLHLLIQHVIRAFYDSRHIVVFDQLVRGELAIKDEVLSAKLGVNVKELAKAAQPLIENRLLGVYRRNEVRDGASKATSRSWYYLDYKTFVDAVKWRIAKMRKNIDIDTRDEIAAQGYDCPLCRKKFSTLDASELLKPTMDGFACDVCGSDLVENASSAEVVHRKSKVKRLNEQIRYIADGLKKTEAFTMPALDVKRWLDINHPAVESAAATVTDNGLKIATGGGQAIQIKVEMTSEAQERARKEEKDREDEAKRIQNALPSWLKSSAVAGAPPHASASESTATLLAKVDSRPTSPEKETGSSEALLAYYANLSASTSQIKHEPGTTPLFKLKVEDVESDDDDDLFDKVSTAAITPPTSYEEDVPPLNKPRNAFGKRSREPSPNDDDAASSVSKKSRPSNLPSPALSLTEDKPLIKSEPTAAAPAIVLSDGESSDGEEFDVIL